MHKNHLGQIIGAPLEDFQTPEFPPLTPMRGNYCRLEHLDIDSHAEQLYAANSEDSDSRNWTYLPYGPFADLATYTQWMRHSCFTGDPIFYAIIDLQTGAATGVASYLRITPASASIEVGHINFSPLLQRTPAATESMYLLMRRAFELGYRRYEWKCDALNKPSNDAAIRLGFSYEGIFRQATHYKTRNRDTAWYAVIDSEWPALKGAFESWLGDDNFDSAGKQIQSLSVFTSAAGCSTGNT